MKIVCIAAYLPDFAPLARITIDENRAEYCEQHGYGLMVKRDGWTMPAAHPVSWDRLKFMRDVLDSGNFEWAWCAGADLLITNPHIPLEDRIDSDFHVIAAADWCAQIQADSFLVRASASGIGWLSDLLALYPQYKDNKWVENAAMIDTMEKYKGILKILPQWQLNSYPYHLFRAVYPTKEKVRQGLDFYGHRGNWVPGDFVCHWPSLPVQVRLREIQKMQAFVRHEQKKGSRE